MTPPTRLVLVRHGETDASAQGQCCGRRDPALTQTGIRQMRATASMIKAVQFNVVYSSPSLRAIQSAQLLAPGIEHCVDDRLREIDFGTLEGLRHEEAAVRFPDVFRTWMNRPDLVSFPGGEGFRAMRARVVRALLDLLRRHASQTIAVVAHGGVNRVVLGRALGLPSRHIFRLAQDHAAVSVIEYYGSAPQVRAVNLTSTTGAGAC